MSNLKVRAKMVFQTEIYHYLNVFLNGYMFFDYFMTEVDNIIYGIKTAANFYKNRANNMNQVCVSPLTPPFLNPKKNEKYIGPTYTRTHSHTQT